MSIEQEHEMYEQFKIDWPYRFKLGARSPKPHQVGPFLKELGIEFGQTFYTFGFKNPIDLLTAMSKLRKKFKDVPLID